MDEPNLHILTEVAEALGELRKSLVFVGGCATGLLLTSGRTKIRVTKDVDLIAEVASYKAYHAVEKQIEACGFAHDISDDAPICRWIKDGIKVDLMPTDAGILSFHNRWYRLAVETASNHEITDTITIRLISAPVFIATKLEAFHGRGSNDFLASHDLEDVVTLLDGRENIVSEIQSSDPALVDYLRGEFTALLASDAFQSALPGLISTDIDREQRLSSILEKMKTISKLQENQ